MSSRRFECLLLWAATVRPLVFPCPSYCSVMRYGILWCASLGLVGVTEVMAWNCEAPWNGNNESTSYLQTTGLPRKQTIPYISRSVICIYLLKTYYYTIQMILCVKSLVGQLKHGWLRVLVPSEILYRKKMGPCAFSSCCVVMLGITSCQGRLFWSPANTTRFEPSSHLFVWVGYIFWNTNNWYGNQASGKLIWWFFP